MGDIAFPAGRRPRLASSVHQFIAAQALHLREGRIDALARGFRVPLVVSLPGVRPEFIVLSSRAAIEHFFRLKKAALQAAGISGVRVHVAQTQPTGRGRVTAFAEWYYLGPDGCRAGRTTVRYFMERRNGAISVHMLELEQLAFPALADWFREAGAERPHDHPVH